MGVGERDGITGSPLLRLASQSKQFKSHVGVGVSQRDGTHAPLPSSGCPAAQVIRALKSWDLRSGTGVRDSRDTARSSIGPCKRGLFKIYAAPPAFKYLICQLIWYFDKPQFLLVFALSSSQNTCLFTTQ